MSEFLIFNNNNNFKIKFSLDTKISEVKKIIFEKFNFSGQDNFYIFLEKSGFIDINPSNLNSPLSSLNSLLSKLTQPYNLFCLNLFDPESYNIFCTKKITEENEISQTGIKLKDKDIILCLSCSKYCYNISFDKIPSEELITDKVFKCQCDKCKYECFNLKDINFGSNSKDEFINKIISLIKEKKNEIEDYKKKKKMLELKEKILKRDFEFEYIINLLEPRLISYKNPELQNQIKKIIPPRPEGTNSEQYVKLLLKWFKKDYFTWCNKPKCPKCGQNENNLTSITYIGKPNASELKYLAYKTEIYKCNKCEIEVRFPRCNNPIILLETRTGRCSEWSNLFGAILYTCGFKVRLINNFEDHVWNEFYNEEEQRWIHLDSCEEAYDTPLVYEQGWGRVMTFILGMSDDGLVEVTPRYVKDWKIIKERRSEKMEIKLKKIMEEVNKRMVININPQEKKNIENRRKSEIKMFEEKIKKDLGENLENSEDNKNDNIKDEEKIGRRSGSLEWRKNRGEC